jgi:eukaryotic-like serine/threonine-protein kinase
VASKPVTVPGIVRFGQDFELDLRAYQLRSGGTPLKLKPIAMELLIFLVERNGELVTRDQIVERIWGKGVFLDTDNSINNAVSKVRQALRDDPEKPRFVLTIPGKGYRFIATVFEEKVQPEPEFVPQPAAPTTESWIGKKISHYRILELLGGGGMGIVYRAEDLKLGRRVAIKFMPVELATDPRAFERFEREARAASSLDHRNICSIYQLGEYEHQPFIVMQLLEGETLREWIERNSKPAGRRSWPDLLEIAIQIANGLDAAHQKGIIHRDIKPANIFRTNAGEVKILDFGVAKFTENAENFAELQDSADASNPSANPSLTRTGISMGTPSYLSPEQIRGEILDARADLFSFGVVLHEMATGQKIFAGNTAAVVRDAILNEPTTSSRQINPEIPVELDQIIVKTLEKDRDRRYKSARDLSNELQLLRDRIVSRPRSGKKWAWIFGAAAALLLVGLLALPKVRDAFFHSSSEAKSASAFRVRPAIAVLNFKNLSGRKDEDWISTGLAEMLAAELAEGEELRVVPGENVGRMHLDLALPPSDSYAAETLAKIRTHLGADLVLTGSYLVLGEGPNRKIRVELHIQNAREGGTDTVLSENGTESDLADMVTAGASGLREKLGLESASPTMGAKSRSPMPANTAAMRLYAEGVAKVRVYDALAARDLLEKAVSADPQHALSHSLLAESYSVLGYDQRAQAEAKKAFDLAPSLPRAEQLLVEGRYRELSHDLPSAVEAYRTLWKFFPDDLDAGLRLAAVQIKSGSAKDALATAAQLRQLPPPANQDPRIDLANGKASEALGDFRRAQQVAAAAVAKANLQENHLLMAEAEQLEAWAWERLGDLDKSAAEFKQSRDLFLAGHNPRGEAAVLDGIANVLYDKGDLDGARQSYQEGLEIARRLGTQATVAIMTSNLGNIYYEQGKFSQAREHYEEALKIDRERGDQRALGSDLGSIANVMDREGELAAANREQDAALAAFRSSGDRRGEASTLNNLGDVLLEQGKLQLATSNYEEALRLQQDIGYRRGRGFSLFGLSEVLQVEDKLSDARAKTEEAIALRKELSDENNLVFSQMQLAGIALKQGNVDEAETLARAAVVAFGKQKMPDGECIAETIVGLAVLVKGDTAQAETITDHALALSQQSADRDVRFETLLANAKAKASVGKFGEASRILEKVSAEARRYGYIGYEFKSRLQVGELEIQSGKSALGRSHLEQLEKDARAAGFLYISRKAAAAYSQGTTAASMLRADQN